MQCVAIERVVAYLRIPPMPLACAWTLAPGCAFVSRRCSLRPVCARPCRKPLRTLKASSVAPRPAGRPSASSGQRTVGETRSALRWRVPATRRRSWRSADQPRTKSSGFGSAMPRSAVSEVRARGHQALAHGNLQRRPCTFGLRSRTLEAMNTKVSRSLSSKACTPSEWPNPSIEGTSTSGLRPLAAAPHVKR